MSNLESQIARMHQRIQELEARVDMLLDQRVLASGSGPIDISAAVRDSNGRVGSLADLFYVDSDGILQMKSAEAGQASLCQITAGSAGSWSVRRVAANGDLYGDTYTGVTVPSGHNDSGCLATSDYVVCMFPPATSTDTTPTPKIVNYFFIDTTP